MLGTKDAIANLAVKNLDTARKFYEETLGLKPVDQEGDELVTYKSGNSILNVYRSDFAGTNQATAMTWEVGNALDQEMQALREKGVTFEHYDNIPGMQEQGDCYVGEGYKIAWFKDPDGNILSLMGEEK